MEDLHLSFEFFPTKTAVGTNKLLAAHQQLSQFEPDLFTMTYGAGGSTREHTLHLVNQLQHPKAQSSSDYQAAVAPHISCIGHTESELHALITGYQHQKLESLVVLRGDLPSGLGVHQGDFKYARDLVRYVREQTQDHFEIFVAAYPEVHPQAESYQHDLEAFIEKVDAGADAAITQFFFNPDAYFYFVEQLESRGIDLPVLPGIMPIGNFSKLARFADTCGAEIPRWIRRRLEAYGDDTASIRAFGLEVVIQLCDDLLANDAPGLHFYTLNDASLSSEILKQLGW